jgi:hypothetical protein
MRYEPVRGAIETISHIAVTVAIPLFFVQQALQERSHRAENAMQFIAMANDKYSDVISALSEPWEAIDVSALKRNNPTPEGMAQAKFAVMHDVRDRDIERLTEFYKAVLICRRGGYCDPKLIDDFFRTNITFFYCAYDVRLDSIAKRLNRPDYVTEVKAYAGNCS